MNEIWKPVKDYEDLYDVSNFGRVRSLGMWVDGKNGSKRFVKGRVLRPGKNRYGYLYVGLCKDGVMKLYKVHRLVAMAFLPNPNDLPQVNHKDQNKENNCVENLEWCDGKYNTTYSIGKTVYMYTLDDKLCGLWPSTQECGRHEFRESAISRCCNGKLKKYKGFKWSYEPPKPLLTLPYYLHCTSVQVLGNADMTAE